MFLTHVAAVALPLLLVPTIALFACAAFGQAALADDYPDDVRALMPEFTPAERRRGTVLATVFLVSLLAATFVATLTWIAGTHASGFAQAYGMAFATLVAFCLIDLVIVDWIVLCWWRPSWIVVRGTEEAGGGGDYLFHVREQLSRKGLAAMFGLPLVIAGAATATHALL
ncbi:Uncharacterised protein (plasmid) [Tsukamurella tyrosinosolvens]|uniref:Uncharacterized protein n=1 Tax=Tsukamurella tyrosinosolvens TaxID=57704 RepID=A0A1H4QCH8_TSUTY|nr:hypothetical protein [Tsukamurella tyrosinosolvens]KXO91593.1 hypothetical protein AXK58_20635 [Tsukamurella tyrosinosolvens]SEC17365.1 hypothetical protein SAMN04489793_1712 [Tsukamurella tyrosinosolvens]VEH92809.1 Uncharacterised protein [Tsukamurella tyrosinosolvens]